MNSPDGANILSQRPSSLDPASGNQPGREETQDPRCNGHEMDAGEGTKDLKHLPLGGEGLESVRGPRVLLDEAHLVGETGEQLCKVKR